MLIGDGVAGAQRLNHLHGQLATNALVIKGQNEAIMGGVPILGHDHLLYRHGETGAWVFSVCCANMLHCISWPNLGFTGLGQEICYIQTDAVLVVHIDCGVNVKVSIQKVGG